MNPPYLSPGILAFFLVANVRKRHRWIHKRKRNPHKSPRGWHAQMHNSSDYNLSGSSDMWGFGNKSWLKLSSLQGECCKESILTTLVSQIPLTFGDCLALIKTITVSALCFKANKLYMGGQMERNSEDSTFPRERLHHPVAHSLLLQCYHSSESFASKSRGADLADESSILYLWVFKKAWALPFIKPEHIQSWICCALLFLQ